MTQEKMKYRAGFNSKGLDTTGVTEDHARSYASNLGSHHMFIVEGRVTTVITDEEGNQKVALVLTNVEPVPEAQEETVREFQRALWRQRPEQAGQAVLAGTSGQGMSVSDAAAALAAQIETNEETGEAEGIWDGDTDGPLTEPEEEDLPQAEDAPEEPSEPESSEDTVVMFSGKAKRG